MLDADPAPEPLRLRLPYRPPYDWEAIVRFLAARAIPGVESVSPDVYRRTYSIDGVVGTLEVRPSEDEPCLVLSLPSAEPGSLPALASLAGALFDVSADPRKVGAHLRRDRALAPLVAARPGLRVPGAFSTFELAVRAVLGQQVSVKAATTLAGRFVAALGRPLRTGTPGLTHLFPEPRRVARADLSGLGLTGARQNALGELARAFVSGAFPVPPARSLDELVAALGALPGFGPWTANYVAMRAFREPDALPTGDLGLLRALSEGGARISPRELADRAESWRPWRAYAALHLWTHEGDTP